MNTPKQDSKKSKNSSKIQLEKAIGDIAKIHGETAQIYKRIQQAARECIDGMESVGKK